MRPKKNNKTETTPVQYDTEDGLGVAAISLSWVPSRVDGSGRGNGQYRPTMAEPVTVSTAFDLFHC